MIEAINKSALEENKKFRELLAECTEKLKQQRDKIEEGASLLMISANRIEVLTRALENVCDDQLYGEILPIELIEEAEEQLMLEKGSVN